MKRTALLILVSTMLGGFIVYTLAARSSLPKAQRLPDGHVQANMEKDIEALRREVALLKHGESPRALRADGTPEGPSPQRARSRNPEVLAKELEARSREGGNSEGARRHRARLEEKLSGERREPQWATETEQQIEAVLGAIKSGAALKEVNCAATVCRVVVKLDDETVRQGFAFAVSTKAPFTEGTYYAYDGPMATMYVARKGHDLPGEEE